MEDCIANCIGEREKRKTLLGKQMTFREDKWFLGDWWRDASPDSVCVGVIRSEFFSERFMTTELFWEALLLGR